jgi:AcrR family transcriptional regulator
MSRRDEGKADTRDRVARAARALFEARGFAGTTVRMIADAAGVGTGTVLFHFGSKVDLLVLCWAEEIEAAIVGQLATMPAGPVEAQIAHIFRGFYAVYGARPDLARVYVQQLLVTPADRAGPYDAVTAAFIAQLAGMVATAPLRREADPAVLARAVFGLYVLDLATYLRDPVPPDEAAARLEREVAALLRPCVVGAPLGPESETVTATSLGVA